MVVLVERIIIFEYRENLISFILARKSDYTENRSGIISFFFPFMAGIGLRQPLIALILLLLLVPLSAHEKILHFTQFTVEDGLASMETYDVIQDQKGYIWIGTDAGLCRFDGYSFRVFTTRNGLSNNDVINLYEGAGNRIWIQSLGPLAYLENGRFHLFKPEGFEYDNHWFSFIEVDPD